MCTFLLYTVLFLWVSYHVVSVSSFKMLHRCSYNCLFVIQLRLYKNSFVYKFGLSGLTKETILSEVRTLRCELTSQIGTSLNNMRIAPIGDCSVHQSYVLVS